MAQRNASKGKQAPGRSSAKPTATAIAEPDLEAASMRSSGVREVVSGDLSGRLAKSEADNLMLQADRDRLRIELDTVQERLRILEDERKRIGDRVGWAIDSLQGLLENSKGRR